MDLETQIDLDITAYVWDIQNGTFSDYDLSEYRRICALIKGLEKPSPRMLQFLAKDVIAEKEKCLQTKIAKLIEGFRTTLEAKYYWSEYQKICELIEQLNDAAFFSKQKEELWAMVEDRGLVIEIDSRIAMLVTSIEKKQQSLNYESIFHGICDMIKRLKEPAQRHLDFLSLDITAFVLETQLKAQIDEDIENFYQHWHTDGDISFREFKAICSRIDKVSRPSQKMLAFRRNEVSVRQYEEGKKLTEEIQKDMAHYRGLELPQIRIMRPELLKKLDNIDIPDVARLKNEVNSIIADKVVEWFEHHVTKNTNGDIYVVDRKQAMVIADEHKNLLVQALAGSGKTGTLVAKIVYLVAICNINPDSIIAFAFNKDAAKEINNRLASIRVDGQQIITKAVATTFHSFAYNNVRHNKILCDSKEQGPELSKFIQDIVFDNVSPEELYSVCRKLGHKIEKKYFVSEDDFYQMVRAQEYKTLDNTCVKSRAEKVICDFLFEHGIEYMYEPVCYTSNLWEIAKQNEREYLVQKESIKPDFLLKDSNLVWEHWGITGRETEEEIEKINAAGHIGKYSEYKTNMDWKKWFYAREWVDPSAVDYNKYAKQVKDWNGLVETYYNPTQSREEFENTIKELLNKQGIKTEKLSRDILVRQVWKSHMPDFAKLIAQFINRAEQSFLNDIEALEEKVKSVPEYTREREFLDIAIRIYKLYMQKIKEHNQYDMDFNMLMDKASKSIKDNQEVDITKKQYIFIDEFQDFSKLFFDFIDAIKQKNPYCNVMCVGDTYQAINRFAGSDVKYFDNFGNYFQYAYILTLDTNYRCNSNIVDNARVFMQKHMDSRESFNAHKSEPGNVNTLNISDVFIERRRAIDVTADADRIFKTKMSVSDKRAPEINAVRYLKSVVWIIKQNKDKNSIKLLHRNNDMSFWFVGIERFLAKVKEACIELGIMSKEEFEKKVSIGTIHSVKGQEADVVVILEADASIMSALHPDATLFEVFGETPNEVLKDQKRLFYVAITRAKEQLWILYDGADKTAFLNGLPANEIDPRTVKISETLNKH